MDYRNLGRSGLVVSVVGLGTNNFGPRLDLTGTRRVIDAAIDCGITFMDTADVYGAGASEDFIGQALIGRRNRMVIATKFGRPMSESPYDRGGSRNYIMRAADASLRRLATDHIDLYQMHRPDPRTPLVETLQALDDLVRSGKVRYIGTSNYSAWSIVDADWTARAEHLARPISAQHQYNLLLRDVEQEVLPACEAIGLGFIPFSPLLSGFLTGKYTQDLTSENGRLASGGPLAEKILTKQHFDRLQLLEAFARERHRELIDLAFGWLLGSKSIATVIAGAMSPEQVAQNVRAAEWRLSPQEMEAVAAL